MRIWLWRLLIPALLIWSYFARPFYDFAWIAKGRLTEMVMARTGPPLVRDEHAAIVGRTLDQGDEIDAWLRAQREAGARGMQAALHATSLPEHERQAEALRVKFRASLRYPPAGMFADAADGPGSAIQEKALGEDEFATYRELRIPVMPGVHAVGIYVRPRGAAPTERLPLVIGAHGRGGMPTADGDGKLPLMGRSNRDLAWTAVRRGYAVWLPIYVHYGRRGDDFRDRLTVRAWTAGSSLPAIEIAKTVRAIDVLARRPDIDPERIGMVGISYGGFYTLYTTALEPRIKAAVVAAYFNDRAQVLDSSEPYGFLDWRYADSLSSWRDPVVAALVAPRPLLIEAGNQDQLFPIEGARRAAPEAQGYYQRIGVGERFRFMELVARHDFAGAEAMDFLDKHLEAGAVAAR